MPSTPRRAAIAVAFQFHSPGGQTEIIYAEEERAPLPDFSGPSLMEEGEEISLSDFEGEVVVLNAWGQWCAPCRAEVDDLQLVHADHGDVLVHISQRLRIWQPKGAERGFFGAVAKPLPSAKKLDALAYKSAIITLPVLGLGIVLGAIWAEASWGRFWGWDPKETASFISWVLYAAYLHARATAGWRDHKATWISILAPATIIFNLFFINLVVSGLHSYAGLN